MSELLIYVLVGIYQGFHRKSRCFENVSCFDRASDLAAPSQDGAAFSVSASSQVEDYFENIGHSPASWKMEPTGATPPLAPDGWDEWTEDPE
jgi:hypothetical protein